MSEQGMSEQAMNEQGRSEQGKSEPRWDPIERLVRSCPTRTPSEALDERVSQALRAAGPERSEPARRAGLPAALPATLALGLRLGWPVGAAVAAALVMALTLVGWIGAPSGRPKPETGGGLTRGLAREGPGPVSPSSQGGPIALPVRLDHVYRVSVPTHHIHLVEGLPVRQFEERSVRRTLWLDGRGEARMEWTQPERAYVLTPIRFD